MRLGCPSLTRSADGGKESHKGKARQGRAFSTLTTFIVFAREHEFLLRSPCWQAYFTVLPEVGDAATIPDHVQSKAGQMRRGGFVEWGFLCLSADDHFIRRRSSSFSAFFDHAPFRRAPRHSG